MDHENGVDDKNEETDLIKAGETVILHKFNYMRTHVFNPNKNLQLGRDVVSMAGLLGKKYGTTFEMVAHPTKKKIFELKKADEVVDFESLFLTGEGGQDNRDLDDTEASQKLSRKQVEEMRDSGVSGKVIMEKLVENSETFQSKTKFSQAKFLKKKAKKYHHYICIRRPTIRLLIEILYKMDPIKINNLRIDSLSQILNMVNVQSGGRYMVYETGAQGIVVAAMLERLGDSGELVHVYQTGQPQTACINSMGLHKSDLLKTLNLHHLRSIEQGRDITQLHKPLIKDVATNQEATIEASINGEAAKDDYTSKEGAADASANQDAAAEGSTNQDEAAGDDTEEPAAKKMKTDGEENGGLDNDKKPVRMNLREKSVEAYNSIKSKKLDGLVIVCKQHPGNLITYLSKFVAPSRPFVVYSPYKEPLLDTYMVLKDKGLAVMVNLSETWLRSHQVLPQRTHPTVLMSGGGGYLLTGIFVHN